MDYFDILLAKKLNGGGGGGDIDLQTLNVTENGTVNAPSGVAYNKVITNVPAPSNAIYKQTLSNLPQSIATFTGADAPIDSLKASIEGVQSGSGDPSPSNVRPISGWTSCEVTRTGKNLLDTSNIEIQLLPNTSGNNRRGILLNTEVGLTYTISSNGEASSLFLLSKTGDNLPTPIGSISSDRTITPISDTIYYLIYATNISESDFKDYLINANIQFELGDQATTFEPYSGNTYTIQFKDSSDNPINAYRGTIDISTGVATFTHKLVTFNGSETWGTTSGVFRVDITGYKKGEFVNGACNAYKMVSEAYNAASMDTDKTCSFVRNADFNRFMVKDSSFASLTDFQTWLSTNNLQVAYELETPITMQFYPIAIRTDGVTNISVNCGEVTELKYYSETP